MPVLYATPYDISYHGFYFESADEFDRKMKKAPFEEVEIQFIDGTPEESLVFSLCKPHQQNIGHFFDALQESYEPHQLAAISYLIEDQGLTWDEATTHRTLDDVDVYAMDMKKLSEHFAEEGIYPLGVNERILPYLDYDLLARDLSMDYAEIRCLGETYCVRSA